MLMLMLTPAAIPFAFCPVYFQGGDLPPLGRKVVLFLNLSNWSSYDSASVREKLFTLLTAPCWLDPLSKPRNQAELCPGEITGHPGNKEQCNHKNKKKSTRRPCLVSVLRGLRHKLRGLPGPQRPGARSSSQPPSPLSSSPPPTHAGSAADAEIKVPPLLEPAAVQGSPFQAWYWSDCSHQTKGNNSARQRVS